MEAIKVLAKILTNILTALYEPFGFSLLLSFFAMFFYLYAYEPSAAGKGWKNAIVTWYQKFKESVFFRKLFLLTFVTSMILFRTLLNRNLWLNPLSDVMGGWGIWETKNGEQVLITECIENVIMMVPFSAVVMWTFGEKIGNGWKKILWYSGKIAFIFSISIETLLTTAALIFNYYGRRSICLMYAQDYREDVDIMEFSEFIGTAQLAALDTFLKGWLNAAQIDVLGQFYFGMIGTKIKEYGLV